VVEKLKASEFKLTELDPSSAKILDLLRKCSAPDLDNLRLDEDKTSLTTDICLYVHTATRNALRSSYQTLDGTDLGGLAWVVEVLKRKRAAVDLMGSGMRRSYLVAYLKSV
jgi:hypothetical protein